LGKKAIKKLIEVKEDTGMTYTAHLPLWSIELSSPYPSVRRGSVEATIEAIRAVEPLDPEIYVLHATGALAAEFYHMNVNQLAIDYTMKMFKENATISIKEILDAVDLPSKKIAVETINFPLDMTIDIAEELDLSICFDVGHVLAGFSGNISFFKALDLCLPRLAEIHLHDSPLMGDDSIPKFDQDHISLGLGDLNIKMLLNVLNEASFEGPIIYELTLEQAIDSNLTLQKFS
ncbi:MAG: sugar phosphate isomerase/epimerase, partial [Candidatus Heimdallarchaeota archaeon]|nr:sugar phosphate isomerase/epimerase [Candidatus Heimdallarchaeota archaeon]